MTADTTQPAGALPEPDERACIGGISQFVWCEPKMRAHALDYHIEKMRLQGLADGAVSLNAYTRRGEALHESRAETAAMRAERDAALRKHATLCDAHLALTRNHAELMAEAAALRRELEELRAQKSAAAP
jgi:hypothetical protein